MLRLLVPALLLGSAGCADPPADPPAKTGMEFVEFNAPDGEHVYVSPSGMILRGEKAVRRGLYHSSVKCIILSGGQTIPVLENCGAVEERLTAGCGCKND